MPALTAMPRGRKKRPVASATRGDGSSPGDRGERGASGGRLDVSHLRAQFEQMNGAAPGSASASQPDRLPAFPQVQIAFCCHTFAVLQSQLEGRDSRKLLRALGSIVAQAVLDNALDLFVSGGVGGHEQGLEAIGKEYKDVLAPAFGSDVEAEALQSSTAAWNLGRSKCKLHKIAAEVKQLSDGMSGAGVPILAMWAFRVWDMTCQHYGFLCVASLSVTRLRQTNKHDTCAWTPNKSLGTLRYPGGDGKS